MNNYKYKNMPTFNIIKSELNSKASQFNNLSELNEFIESKKKKQKTYIEPLTINDITKVLYAIHGKNKNFQGYKDKAMTILLDNEKIAYRTLFNDPDYLFNYINKRCKATATKHKYLKVALIIMDLIKSDNENLQKINKYIDKIELILFTEKANKKQKKEDATKAIKQEEKKEKSDVNESIKYINNFVYPKIEEVKENEKNEVITYNQIIKAIDNGLTKDKKPYTEKSKKSLKACFNKINDYFNNPNDYRELIQEPKKVIDVIYNLLYTDHQKTKNLFDSSKRSYLSMLLFLIRTFKPNEEHEKKISVLISTLSNNIKVKTNNDIHESNNNIKVAYKMMEKMKNNTGIFEHLVLNYGVMRADELFNMYVVDSDKNDHDNFINIKTKTMTIKKHKNMSRAGNKKTKLDNDFINMVKDRLGKCLFMNLKKEPYKTAKGFNDTIIKLYGCSIKEIRKMKTSIILKENNNEERERVALFQGHNVNTMISYYKTYN